jgi:hypothetical protein
MVVDQSYARSLLAIRAIGWMVSTSEVTHDKAEETDQ